MLFNFLNYINQLIALALFGDGWATHRMWTSQGVLGPWAFCVESANSDASPDPRQWSTVAKMGERAVTTCYSGWLRNPAVDRWKTSHSFCWVSTCFNHRWCRISQPPTVWKLFGEAWETYWICFKRKWTLQNPLNDASNSDMCKIVWPTHPPNGACSSL